MPGLRPYRTAIRVCSREEVERHNRRHGLTHGRRLEPAPEAIVRLESQRNANADRRSSWTHHPDERVPLALLNRPPSCALWSGEAGVAMAETLLGRARSEAREEGVLWTPLLNGLLGSEACHQVRSEVLEHLDELGDWIARRDDPRTLEELVGGFPGPWVAATVARRGRAIDPALVDRFAATSPDGVARLVRNPASGGAELARAAAHAERWALKGALDPAARRAVSVLAALRDRGQPARAEILRALARHLEDVEGARGLDSRDPRWAIARELLEQPELPAEALASHLPAIVRLVPGLHPLASHPEADATTWLRALELRDDPFLTRRLSTLPVARQDPEVADLLLRRGGFDVQMELASDVACPVRKEAVSRAVELVSTPGDPPPNSRRSSREAWSDLLALEGLQPRHLRDLFLKARQDPPMVRRLARHPAGGRDLYRFMIERSRTEYVRQALSAIPEARADDRVRAALRRTGRSAILADIAPAAPDGELQEILTTLAERAPEAAARAIEGICEAGRVQSLGVDDLTRLLRSEHREVRQAVMLAMGELEAVGQGRAGAAVGHPSPHASSG